jgi:hypothetical protein
MFNPDNTLAESVEWMFNLNHIYLLLAVVFIITVITILVTKLNKKTQEKFLLFSGIFLIVLEFGRIGYKMYSHLSHNPTLEGFNWWWNISFQMCAIMVWFTAINLIVFYFKKQDSKYKQWAYNVMFGAALIGGALSFLYPDMISENHSILHFSNLQTIVAHAFLIMLPIIIVISGRLKVRYKNIGKVFLGLVMVATIAMPASLISGQNFAFMSEFGALVDAGIDIPFPLHIIVLALIFFVFTSLLYGPFEIIRLWKENNKIEKEESKEEAV